MGWSQSDVDKLRANTSGKAQASAAIVAKAGLPNKTEPKNRRPPRASNSVTDRYVKEAEPADNVMSDSGADHQRTAFVLDKLIRGDVSELKFEEDGDHKARILFRRWGYDIVLTIKQSK